MRFPFLSAGLALVAVIAGAGAYGLYSFNHFGKVERRFDGA